jgi:hypothetical protein
MDHTSLTSVILLLSVRISVLSAHALAPAVREVCV